MTPATSTAELLGLALVAVVQLLSLVVSQVLARRRQADTLGRIREEQRELVRQVSQRPPERLPAGEVDANVCVRCRHSYRLHLDPSHTSAELMRCFADGCLCKRWKQWSGLFVENEDETPSGR